MSIQITDCTIRDGGYLFNKNSNPEFVKGIMKGLAEAGIDFVETGFLQTNVTGETLVYADSVDARKYLPENRKNTQLTIKSIFFNIIICNDTILCRSIS